MTKVKASANIMFNVDTLLRAAYYPKKPKLYLWFGSLAVDADGDEPASSISFTGELAEEMYAQIADLPILIEEITIGEGMYFAEPADLPPPLEAARS